MSRTDDDSGIRRGTENDSTVADRLAEGWRRFARRWDGLSRPLRRGARHSRTGGAVGRWQSAVRHSRIVQWLTREPDPRVVVIDLAETRTIGPILRLLDRFVSLLEPSVRTSTVGRLSAATADAAARNVVPIVSAILLGLVVGTLVRTWAGAGPLWLAALAIAAVAGVLGLVVDRSTAALERSTAVAWATALVAPPEEATR